MKVVRLTPNNGHYFFGYYDLKAWDINDEYHLTHRVSFCDHIPSPDDIATIGMIRMKDLEFIELTQTRAWNFQQGAMLQWLPTAPNSKIIFNDRVDNRFVTVIFDVNTLKRQILPLPIAALSNNGRTALSINFSRMFTFRPGYGYAGIKDPYENQLHPKEDGIFLMDLETGEYKIILSLYDIMRMKIKEDILKSKILINHITYNTDDSRFIFLSRYMIPAKKGWLTAAFTANADGSDVKCIIDYGCVSHYYWVSPCEILVYTDINGQGRNLYLINDRTGKSEFVDKEVFKEDAHISTSPDRKWILADTYPDKEGFRTLRLYNIKEKKDIILGKFFSPKAFTGDIRCDLHPRWNRKGTMVSFDSIHENKRGIYAIDVKEIIANYEL
jgi:hypothetical protein